MGWFDAFSCPVCNQKIERTSKVKAVLARIFESKALCSLHRRR